MSTQAETQETQASGTLELSGIAPGMTVGDLQASLHWYCDVVGFQIDQKFEQEGVLRGASLAAGSMRVMISQDDWSKGRDRLKGVGHRLYMSTEQDIDELANGIKARGGTLATEPEDMPWGARAFNLVDPDGFQLTISSMM